MLVVGIMSGTSMDAIDACLLQIEPRGLTCKGLASLPIEPALRAELMALQQAGHDEMHRAQLASLRLTQSYAQVCAALLRDLGIAPAQIAAIGAHGQTIRHRPELGYTVQLLNGSALADLTNIDVVCDFRSADISAGGQGAPLVPGFHREVFQLDSAPRAALNLGGFANLSFCSGGALRGFDTGPANVLVDAWIERHRGLAYDERGAWAATGQIQLNLLKALRAHPFFALDFPKSTGRDVFHLAWLDGILSKLGQSFSPQDVQATLVELSAQAVVDALISAEALRHSEGDAEARFREVVMCGGGHENQTMVERLRAHRTDIQWTSSRDFGLHPMAVEACAFAWLAAKRLAEQPAVAPSVTGARRMVISGAWYRRP
jgi:anhydro-N-acetylmuramic acid kinase